MHNYEEVKDSSFEEDEDEANEIASDADQDADGVGMVWTSLRYHTALIIDKAELLD